MWSVTRSAFHAHDPDHFQRRVLLDTYLDASALCGERRAHPYEAAAPRAGDYPGRATPCELDVRARRLAEIAAACRNRARLLEAHRTTFDDTIADLGAPT